MQPCVLILAGLDPSGGAGLLADAEAVRAQGARPFCVATALTVQSTGRALRFQATAPLLVRDSARLLFEDENICAVKIGMVGAPQVAQAIADLLRGRGSGLPIVVDPVLASSSGAALLKGGPEPYLLLMQGALITPNALEAEALCGFPIRDLAAQEKAGRALVAKGARAALIKGGHVDKAGAARGIDRADGAECADVLVDADGALVLSGPRLAVSKRGTGCRLSSALAAQLALGASLRDAAAAARRYLLSYLAGS